MTLGDNVRIGAHCVIANAKIAPEDIVLVRTYYEWPIISPLLKPVFHSAGHEGRLLSSARIFRNEPYNAALRPLGAKC